MKLYIMRHGETDANRARVLQGRMDICLNEKGREQARDAREQLGNISFDAIYVSPLIRAVETAELVTGMNRDGFILDDRLLEISFGKMEGKTPEELGTGFQNFFSAPEQYKAVEGAESYESLIKRVADFLEELKTKKHNQVLVVSHGAAIHAMLMVIEGKSLSEFWNIDVGNCGVTEVGLRENAWIVTHACETKDAIYGKEASQAVSKTE